MPNTFVNTPLHNIRPIMSETATSESLPGLKEDSRHKSINAFIQMDFVDILAERMEWATIREHLFDHAYMASMWESRCERAGWKGKPSILGTLLTDIEKWFADEGFNNVRIYYSFALHLWATRRLPGIKSPFRAAELPYYCNKDVLENVDNAENAAFVHLFPTVYTNTGLKLSINDFDCDTNVLVVENLFDNYTIKADLEEYTIETDLEEMPVHLIETPLRNICPTLPDRYYENERNMKSLRALKEESLRKSINAFIRMDFV
jgi:hypothetical protein